MGLVKSVGGKALDRIEYIGRPFLRESSLDRPIDKLGLLLCHQGFILLAHRPPHEVRFRKRESSNFARNFHDLFLVDDNAVCFLEDRFKLRVDILNLLTLLSANEITDHLHRSRSVEGVHRD